MVNASTLPTISTTVVLHPTGAWSLPMVFQRFARILSALQHVNPVTPIPTDNALTLIQTRTTAAPLADNVLPVHSVLQCANQAAALCLATRIIPLAQTELLAFELIPILTTAVLVANNAQLQQTPILLVTTLNVVICAILATAILEARVLQQATILTIVVLTRMSAQLQTMAKRYAMPPVFAVSCALRLM